LLRSAFWLFLTLGIAALGYAGYVFGDAHIYQAHERQSFENSRLKDAVLREVPHPVVDGGVIGEMEVSRLGLKVIVVQGDSPHILRRAVGHIRETSLPGGAGNVVLTGHRDTFFRPLRNIQPGDAITFKTLDAEFRYQVESTAVVPPDDVAVLRPSGRRTLTLITCFPFYYVGAAPNRFIVLARQVEPDSP
jgi:sortase A